METQDILACNYGESYKSPRFMLDSGGNSKYAYVTYIMMDDRFIPGAITLAYSLKVVGSKADLVAFVTPDITVEGKRVLRIFFDNVIVINYLDISPKKFKKKYLQHIFTKFNLFNLAEYKKVVYLDADTMVVKNPDHLFTLDTPAGVYIGKSKEPVDIGKNYKDLCSIASHGSIIPDSMTNADKIVNRRNYGISGTLLVLTPKVGELDDICYDTTNGYTKRMLERMDYPADQYLTIRYSGIWKSINPLFLGIDGYPDYTKLYLIQYQKYKPFLAEEIKNFEKHHKLWHLLFNRILDEVPAVKSSPILKETIEIGKTILPHIEHDVDDFFREYILRGVENMYQISSYKISDDKLCYYTFLDNNNYKPIDIKPMFPDIKKYDFYTPIKKLSDYYGKESYYNSIISTYGRSIPKDHIMKPSLQVDGVDRDLIMLEYIKCRPNIKIVTVWPKAVNYVNNIINLLDKEGLVYYTKTITLTYEALRNLLHTMYDDISYRSRIEFISSKAKRVSLRDNNRITFIVFDNVNKLPIEGRGAKYKVHLRNKVLMMMKRQGDDTVKGNDVLHINDYFYQTIEIAQTFLNENSLDFLHYRNTDRYSYRFMALPNLKLQTYRKFMFSKLSQIEIDRSIIVGGSLLHTYGIRRTDDIDTVIATPDKFPKLNSNEEIDLSKTVYDNFFHKKTKFSFIDMGLEKSTSWIVEWSKQDKAFLKYFSIPSNTALVTNPCNHFYNQGVKYILIDHLIVKKILRNNYTDHADFIMLSIICPNIVGKYIYFDENFNLTYRKDLKRSAKISNHLRQIKYYITTKYTQRQINSVKNHPFFVRLFKIY